MHSIIAVVCERVSVSVCLCLCVWHRLANRKVAGPIPVWCCCRGDVTNERKLSESTTNSYH